MKIKSLKNIKFYIVIVSIVTIFCILATNISRIEAQSIKTDKKWCTDSNAKSIETNINNINLSLCTSFFPKFDFVKDDLDGENTTLRAQSWSPFREFLIKSIDKDKDAVTEGLLAPDTNNLQKVVDKLKSKRIQDDKDTITNGPEINLFGTKIKGNISVINRIIDTLEPKPIVVIDWATTYKDKTWIIRVSEEQDKSFQLKDKLKSSLVKNFNDIFIKENISLIKQISENKENKIGAVIPANLPNPDWWKGFDPNNPTDTTFRDSCDVQKFPGSKKATGDSVLGDGRVGNVVSCIPRNRPTDNTTLTTFTNGAQGASAGEYTWQCVEYSMRWMRIAYNESSYTLSGSGEARKIMAEYPEGQSNRRLKKTPNGTAPGPKPGDVISTGITGDGHTGIVKEVYLEMDSSKTSYGTGYIVVVDQNSNDAGIRRYDTVDKWKFSNFNGWLHDPTGDVCVPPSAGDWNVSGSCTMPTGNFTAKASVNVYGNSVLTIPNGTSLDINMSSYKLSVASGSGVNVKSGGKIY